MMASTPLRALVVGGRGVGSVHIEAMRHLTEVSVIAVASATESSARATAERFAIPRWSGDYRQLLVDPTVDVVHVCSPNDQHLRIVRDALLAGKHVVCEKPLAATAADAAEMVRLAAMARGQAFLCHKYRYLPLLQRLRVLVTGGELGDVHAVRGHYLQSWKLAAPTADWRRDPRRAGACPVLYDLGTHLLDLVEHVTDGPATNASGHVPPAGADPPGRPLEQANLLLQVGAALGNLVVSQVSPAHDNHLMLQVDGARATATWTFDDRESLTVTRQARRGGLDMDTARSGRRVTTAGWENAEDPLASSIALFQAIYDRIRAESPARGPAPTRFADGLRHLRLVDTVVAADRDGAHPPAARVDAATPQPVRPDQGPAAPAAPPARTTTVSDHHRQGRSSAMANQGPRLPHRYLLVVSFLVSASMLAAACVGNTRTPSDNARATNGPQPGQAATLKVVSQFGDNPSLQRVLNQLNADYRKQHPEVKVEIQYLTLDDLTKTLPTTLASGAGPDLFDYDANEGSLGALAKSNLLLPLDDLAAKYGWKDKLPASTVQRTTYNGKLAGIGRSSETVGLYYNADLLRRLSIPAPNDYASFQAAATALLKAGVTPLTFGNKDLWPSSHLIGAAVHATVPMATIGNIERLSAKGSWIDPTVEKAFTMVRGWAQRGWLTPNFNGVSFDDATKQFFNGKAGMFIEGTGVTPDILENMKGINVRFIPFPMADPQLPQQAEGGLGGAWAISAHAKAPAIAADWINFIHFSPQAERAWLEAGVLPTTNYQPPSDVQLAPLVQDNLTVTRAAQSGAGIGYWTGYSSSPLVTDVWNSAAQKLLDGHINATQFATDLQKALTTARQQAG